MYVYVCRRKRERERDGILCMCLGKCICEDFLVCIFQVSAAVFLSGVCVYICVCERERETWNGACVWESVCVGIFFVRMF